MHTRENTVEEKYFCYSCGVFFKQKYLTFCCDAAFFKKVSICLFLENYFEKDFCEYSLTFGKRPKVAFRVASEEAGK